MNLIFILQLEIEAADQGIVPLKITLTVYIEVDRSTRGPRFRNTPYNRQRISENLQIGELVFQASAFDPDLKVCLAIAVHFYSH